MTSSPPRPLVLVVDDNAAGRRLACDALRLAGLRVIEAASGAEAIGLAVTETPDVVLMDLKLPDISGVEATARLRSQPRTAGVPIVALTSIPESGDWHVAAGFAGYLEKPFDPRRLPEQILAFCAGPADDA